MCAFISHYFKYFHFQIDGEHYTFIEKGWKEGEEYFRVEQPIICHDGESIQGSHVTSDVGTYVLQWRFNAPHTMDLIDSITAHKAQVMYYYEVLSSADYRYVFCINIVIFLLVINLLNNINRSFHKVDLLHMPSINVITLCVNN